MADTKISAMPSATALTGAEVVPLVQGGTNVQSTVSNIRGAYASYQSTVSQALGGANVAQVMTFNTTDVNSGITLGGTSRITATNAGWYNLQWSGQFQNTNVADKDTLVWVKVNGTNVVGSTGFISIPSSHGGVDGHIVTGWNYFLQLTAGQYVELWWTSDSTNVSLQAYAAGGSGANAYPSTASLIATIDQVG